MVPVLVFLLVSSGGAVLASAQPADKEPVPQSILEAHDGPITGLSFNSAGTRFAIADGAIHIWDLATGKKLNMFPGGNYVAFDPKGNRLLAARDDGTVRLLDVETGKELFPLRGPANGAKAVAFSPDGRRFAVLSADGAVTSWDSRTGKELFVRPGLDGLMRKLDKPLNKAVRKLEFGDLVYSPDSQRFVSTGPGAGRLWNGEIVPAGMTVSISVGHADTERVEPSLDLVSPVRPERSLEIGRVEPRCLTFGRDGKRSILISGDNQGVIRLWDFQSRIQVRTFQLEKESIHKIALSPDGRWLAVSASESTRVFQLQNGQHALLDSRRNRGRPVAFSLDGKWLATCHDSGGREGSSVRIWNTQTLEALPGLPVVGSKPPVILVLPQGLKTLPHRLPTTMPIIRAGPDDVVGCPVYVMRGVSAAEAFRQNPGAKFVLQFQAGVAQPPQPLGIEYRSQYMLYYRQSPTSPIREIVKSTIKSFLSSQTRDFYNEHFKSVNAHLVEDVAQALAGRVFDAKGAQVTKDHVTRLAYPTTIRKNDVEVNLRNDLPVPVVVAALEFVPTVPIDMLPARATYYKLQEDVILKPGERHLLRRQLPNNELPANARWTLPKGIYLVTPTE